MVLSIFILALIASASASSCGKKPFNVHSDANVVGGHNAKPGAWPWQARLIIMTPKGLFGCGGSLIHPQWILTAAHCVFGFPIEVEVVLGEHDKAVRDGTEQVFSAAEIIVHERYTDEDVDVALVKLLRPAKLNKYVGLACLPEKGEDEQGNTCFISGWGRTSDEVSHNSPNILQEVSGPIWRWTDCVAKIISWTKEFEPEKVAKRVAELKNATDQYYCFGNGHYGGCSGDSGGPLSCPSAGGWKVVGFTKGVMGGGLKCETVPGMWTKVEPYLDWIKARVPLGEDVIGFQ